MLSRRESSGRFFPARKASSDRGVQTGQAERDEKTRKSRLSDSASNPPARSFAARLYEVCFRSEIIPLEDARCRVFRDLLCELTDSSARR